MKYTLKNTYTKKDIRDLMGWKSTVSVDNWIRTGKLPHSVGPWTNPKRYPADEVDEILGIEQVN